MSATFARVQELVARRVVRVSDHGYDELAQDGLLVKEILAGVATAEVLDDYPDYPKGPSVLVLQRSREGEPVHVVWGIPRNRAEPAVLVTAYRPDPKRWTADYRNRR